MDWLTRHMKLRLLIAFILAFVFGALIAAGTLHPAKTAAANAQADATQQPDTDSADDSDDQHPLAWPASVGSPEQVLYSQAQRMNEALARLSPRTEGKTNLYLIVFAGDGEENVFRNEAEYVGTLFTQRFSAAGHVLTLINNPATLDRYPIASLSNLEIAIDALGKKMNPQQDVLMLFITTHGSREHELYVSLDPLPLDQIEPEDLADLFSDSPIRNRVFVISACYSGGFIDALKNDSTMIITAARKDRSSFGCGTQSQITDFGRAFFVEALNHTASFAQAFAAARKLIDAWETRDGEEHSYPQISSTPKIEARLKAWSDGIKLGAPVPFGTPAQNPSRPAPDRHNPPAVANARR